MLITFSKQVSQVKIIPNPRICSRNKCVEGKLKNGSTVTFNKTKKNGECYKECDQCKDHTDVKNPLVNKY